MGSLASTSNGKGKWVLCELEERSWWSTKKTCGRHQAVKRRTPASSAEKGEKQTVQRGEEERNGTAIREYDVVRVRLTVAVATCPEAM